MQDSISRPALVVAVLAVTCFAGDPFAVPWYTIDGGGVMHSTCNDGRLVLSGTIGQPDAGAMAGGGFKLTGGFWYEVEPGDCNLNGVVDIVDHAAFVACLTGPDSDISGECECFKANHDSVVDLADFAIIQRRFFGK